MSLAIALLLLAPQSPADRATSVLSAVPIDARGIVTCADPAAFRERAERNDWVRLLGSESGEGAFADLEGAMRTSFGRELREIIELARALRGECVLFTTPTEVGFVCTPAGGRERMAEAMRALLPVADGETSRLDADLERGRVEMALVPAAPGAAETRVYGYLDHPEALGLFAAYDRASLVTLVRDCVVGLQQGRRAPVVEAFQAARKEVGPTGGIEAFLDVSAFRSDVASVISDLTGGMPVEPEEVLGMEHQCTLYGTLDLWPGERVVCRGRMAIPEDTLAARFADTLRPLPADLLAKIPGDVWSANAIGLDVVAAYGIVRELLEERRKESLDALDGAIDATSHTTGVDVEGAFLQQICGPFSLYYTEPSPGDPPLTEFAKFGFCLGVLDGDAFLDAAETIAGIALFEAFEQVEIQGFDAFVVGEGDAAQGWPERFDGGAAFLPDACVFATDRAMLDRTMGAHAGVDGASLLGADRFRASFDENVGAFVWTCMELDALRRVAMPFFGDEPTLPSLDGDDGEVSRPFAAQLVGTAKRTKTGIEGRIGTR